MHTFEGTEKLIGRCSNINIEKIDIQGVDCAIFWRLASLKKLPKS